MDLNISSASFEKLGAIKTSKKIELIFLAVEASIFLFVAITEPKADTGSEERDLFHASSSVSEIANPQALLCFIMTTVEFLPSEQ